MSADRAAPGGRHRRPPGADMFSQRFWDDRYASSGRTWSGRPNPALVEHVSALTPATALDAGSGEGADSLWLAGRGWQVTGVDVSPVALRRAAEAAAGSGAGTAELVRWEQADLRTWDPAYRRFDLVTAQYLHLPWPDLDRLFARLARAVAPGGTLLLVGHHPDDPHVRQRRDLPDMYFTAEQVAATLDPQEWYPVRAMAPHRHPRGDVRGGPARDAVLSAVRRLVT